MTARRWDTLEPREFWTLAETAAMLRMDPKTAHRRLIRCKRIVGSEVKYISIIPFHQNGPGAPILIRDSDLRKYVDSIRVEPTSGEEAGTCCL